MKTPREFLLARHRSANPQLNAIRERVLTEPVASRQESRPESTRVIESWREFFRIPRMAWAGLAAAWVVIIALNVASSETAPAPSGRGAEMSRHSPEMLQALREQRRFFAELVGSASASASAAEAPRFIPRPRSEAATSTSVA